MKHFTILGHGDFFGDIIDIIHAGEGRVECVVLNRPDSVRGAQLTVEQRIERIPYEVRVYSLEVFTADRQQCVVVGFGDPGKRPLVESLGAQFEPLIHPSAVVSPTARIGSGVILNAGCVIAPNVMLEEHVIVGHDSHLKKFAVVRPGAHLASHARLGQESIVSLGASIVEGVTIGHHSIVGAGQ